MNLVGLQESGGVGLQSCYPPILHYHKLWYKNVHDQLYTLCLLHVRYIQVTISNDSGVKHIPLYTPNSRHITKAAAWGHKKGIYSCSGWTLSFSTCTWNTLVADHCFKDPCIKKHTIQKISITINRELKKLCSKPVRSILQQSSFENFHWADLITELEEHAPVFSAILKACTQTKHERCNRLGLMGICAAIVLKFRYHRMSLVQKIISTVLHAGHSGKQVRYDLQL